MKDRMVALGLFCSLVLFAVISEAQPVCDPGCARPTDDLSKIETAQRILMMNASDWEELLLPDSGY